jgi:ATP-dependent RNA helicase DeaD
MIELNELFAGIAPDIQQSIRDLGWHTPTPVQAAAIPKMRAGGDLIVQAQTGSGKTGAFGIPLVEAIDTESRDTQAIVLLPTRELANQVAVELDALGRHRGVRTLPIYGGVAYGPQLEGLEKGAHIIVGTPGRILDHLKSDRMDLGRTKVLVLDEADEMLSLGFWPDMKEIASYLPKKRQSHLFSATMPERVRSLSRFFLNDPEDVTIDRDGGSPQQIEHYYYMCAASEKEAVLARILQYENPDSGIIFANTKADVRFVTAYLSRRGFNIDQISGDLPQSAREKAIARIKQGKLRFLVATDVAARGIDISDLAYVVNYTTSDSPEVYVHRTGRTGRAGKSGVAVSLVSGLDIGNFKFMQTVNDIKITEKKAPTERAVARRLEKRKQEEAEENERREQEAELDTLRERASEDLAGLPADEVTARIDRMLPFVTGLAGDEAGLRELARVAAAYLVSPATKSAPVSVPEPDEELPTVEDRETERAREDAANPSGARRSRSGGRGRSRQGGRDGGGRENGRSGRDGGGRENGRSGRDGGGRENGRSGERRRR